MFLCSIYRILNLHLKLSFTQCTTGSEFSECCRPRQTHTPACAYRFLQFITITSSLFQKLCLLVSRNSFLLSITFLSFIFLIFIVSRYVFRYVFIYVFWELSLLSFSCFQRRGEVRRQLYLGVISPTGCLTFISVPRHLHVRPYVTLYVSAQVLPLSPI